MKTVFVQASRTVPVVYKTEMEMSNVYSVLPTLLLIGFLVWSMRRAGRQPQYLSWFDNWICPETSIIFLNLCRFYDGRYGWR